MPVLIGTRDPYQPVPAGTIPAGPGVLTTPRTMYEPIMRRLGMAGGVPAAGDADLQALIDAAMSGLLGGAGGYGGGGGGYGGGAAAVPWGSTQAAAELAQRFALEQMAKEQAFETAEAEKARGFQREQALEELRAARQRMFTDMLGTDPVRAALFAMGVGGEILPEGEQFAALPPLKGAQQYAQQAQTGLQTMLGGRIGVGEKGVTGLPSAVKAATAYSAGLGAGDRPVGDIGAARTLLGSGYGVGAKRGAGRPGMGREELLRQIASVTPMGAY